jgi:hypothetical protein
MSLLHKSEVLFLQGQKKTSESYKYKAKSTNKRIYLQYLFMPHFLFQPDPIDGVEFMPVRMDIHRGVVKIVDEEIHHDFEINNTECVVVGKDGKEVLFLQGQKKVSKSYEYKLKSVIKKKLSKLMTGNFH